MTITTILLAIHLVTLLGLGIYGSHRVHLVWLYHRRARSSREPETTFDSLPPVTVQCPVYNEKFVVERLIDAVAATDYPRDLLEIQVLDDSTDETVDLARARVEHHRSRGIDIHHVHRTNRHGYKAGALEEGLRKARGEFVAVFDADFVPTPDFLRKTIHHFTDPGIGMVQARWGHLNRASSVLTEVQAVLLDAHFHIEHGARNRSGRFFNFNGTAGIWRRHCIEDAGGWDHDTLTEDLDISYRAQMKGWRFRFLPDVVVPAELPDTISSFKAQQHRWSKGAIQVARKILPRLWKMDLPLSIKLEATLHLTNNMAYVFLLILLATIPAILQLEGMWRGLPIVVGFPLFLAATGSVGVFYAFSQRISGAGWIRTLLMIPLVLCFGIGMSVNGVRAVLGAIFGGPSEFVRTPKQGDRRARKVRGYVMGKNILPFIEIALGLSYINVMAMALHSFGVGALLFPALTYWGFLQMGLLSLLEFRPRPAR